MVQKSYHAWQRPEHARWHHLQKVVKLGIMKRNGTGKGTTASAVKQWNNVSGGGLVLHIHMHEDTLVSGWDYSGSWGLSSTCTTYICSVRENFTPAHLSEVNISSEHSLALKQNPHLQVQLCPFHFKSDYYKCNVVNAKSLGMRLILMWDCNADFSYYLLFIMWTKVISEFPWGEVILLIYLSNHSSIQQQQKQASHSLL